MPWLSKGRANIQSYDIHHSATDQTKTKDLRIVVSNNF